MTPKLSDKVPIKGGPMPSNLSGLVATLSKRGPWSDAAATCFLEHFLPQPRLPRKRSTTPGSPSSRDCPGAHATTVQLPDLQGKIRLGDCLPRVESPQPSHLPRCGPRGAGIGTVVPTGSFLNSGPRESVSM